MSRPRLPAVTQGPATVLRPAQAGLLREHLSEGSRGPARAAASGDGCAVGVRGGLTTCEGGETHWTVWPGAGGPGCGGYQACPGPLLAPSQSSLRQARPDMFHSPIPAAIQCSLGASVVPRGRP